ncbi:thiamine phosphate synthase [Lutibacter holmesii]|uniref:Thiamine phosphate synthase n=1 Tax=Lutibacter holmesii TaxID=1137985 RepID=A0ABW3WRR5_9FLAO
MFIPKLHYISQGDSPKDHIENIQKACTSGVELVQLNLKNISEKKYLKTANEVIKITSHFQTRLIILNHYKIAKDIKADGVFLDNLTICPSEVRKHLYTWQLIGVATNTLKDCEFLIAKEVDYLCLGPFKQVTNTNNSTTELGLNGYSLITEALQTSTPIIAFGGVTTKNVLELLKAGVSGVSSSKEITSNFNSIQTFNQLLNASSTKEQRYTFE